MDGMIFHAKKQGILDHSVRRYALTREQLQMQEKAVLPMRMKINVGQCISFFAPCMVVGTSDYEPNWKKNPSMYSCFTDLSLDTTFHFVVF